MTRELLVIVVAAGSLWAGSPLAGRWMGEIDGLPGVRLTVQEDQDKLSGVDRLLPDHQGRKGIPCR